MRPLVLLYLLVQALLLAPPARAQSDSLLLNKADTLVAHKQVKAAIKIYQGVADAKGPGAAQAYVRLAVQAQRREAPSEEVMTLLNQAQALAPHDPYVLQQRSNLYQSMRMYERSYDDLEVALHYGMNDSLRADMLGDQSWDMLNTRHYKEAEALCMKALALDSTSLGALNTLGLALEQLGRVDEALHWMRRYIDVDTGNVSAYHNMGYVLSNHERYQEAMAYFDTAEAKGFKNDPYLYNNRGFVKMKLGDHKGALADIKHSLDLAPGNSYAYRNLGLTYQAMGKRNDACEAFEHALALGYTKRFGDDVKQLYDANCH